MKQIIISCDHCGGSGKRRLPDELAETLAYVKGHPGTTAFLIWEVTMAGNEYTVHAANRRLDRLLRLGLVTRERRSKTFHYTAAKS